MDIQENYDKLKQLIMLNPSRSNDLIELYNDFLKAYRNSNSTNITHTIMILLYNMYNKENEKILLPICEEVYDNLVPLIETSQEMLILSILLTLNKFYERKILDIDMCKRYISLIEKPLNLNYRLDTILIAYIKALQSKTNEKKIAMLTFIATSKDTPLFIKEYMSNTVKYLTKDNSAKFAMLNSKIDESLKEKNKAPIVNHDKRDILKKNTPQITQKKKDQYSIITADEIDLLNFNTKESEFNYVQKLSNIISISKISEVNIDMRNDLVELTADFNAYKKKVIFKYFDKDILFYDKPFNLIADTYNKVFILELRK